MMNTLLDEITQQLTSEQAAWLTKSVKQLATTDDIENDLLDLSVVVKRKFNQDLTTANESFALYSADEIIRFILLKTAFDAAHQQQLEVKSLARAYYLAGDESEKCALLKSFNLLDPQGSAVNVAINSARCNGLIEFSAIALNNTYPSLHFPELNFDQLVLKSLFLGLDISKILGLSTRLNPKLSNMCFSYVVEQALAERVPPASIWLAIQPEDLTDDLAQSLEKYLTYFYQDTAHQLAVNCYIKSHNLNLTLS